MENNGKQPIENIYSAAFVYFWKKLWWLIIGYALIVWVIIQTEILYGLLEFLVIFGIIGVIISYGLIAAKIRRAFWQEFAQEHGWSYASTAPLFSQNALWFQRGRSQKTSNVVSGLVNDALPIRVFEFSFVTGSGKHKTTHHYTVFEFTFSGNFPHLYLNNRRNWDIILAGEHVRLPSEFEKDFQLFGPPQYEIETLQIFDPHTLSFLLQSPLAHDVELVDQKLLIFMKGLVNTKTRLRDEYSTAVNVAQHFQPKLEKFHFTQIGDVPSTLGA